MKKGHTYLIWTEHGILKAKCLDVSQKCFQVKWEGGSSQWLFKSDFNVTALGVPKYSIVEQID